MSINYKLLLGFVLFFSNSQLSFSQNIDSIVVGIKHFRHDSPIWNYQFQTIDSFSQGKKQSNVLRQYNNSQWTNFSWKTYSYDISGNTIDSTIRSWNSNIWVYSNRYLNTFNANNLILNETSQNWDSIAWINNSLITHNYNVSSLDTLILTQSWNNSSWRNQLKNEKTYDINGLLTQEVISTFDTLNSIWKYNSRILHAPHSPGFDAEIITQYYSGNTWVNDYKIEFTYSPVFPNSVLFMFSYRPTGVPPNPWEADRNVYYNYDSLGQFISYFSTCDGACGSGNGNRAYDSLGRLIMNYSYSESMGGISNEDSTLWYYLDYPNAASLNVFLPFDFQKCSSDDVIIDAIVIGGSGHLNFHWTPSIGLSSDTIPNPITFSDSTFNYILQVTDSIGNLATDSVLITVYESPAPLILIASIDTTTLCNSATLSVDSTSGLYCHWYKNDTLQFNPFGFNSAHFPITENGEYVVKEENFYGCINYDTLVFNYFNHPALPVSITSQCNRLIASSMQPQSYQWYRNGLLLSGETNDTINVIVGGEYKVMIIDQNGCVNYSNQQWFAPFIVNTNPISTCNGTCDGLIYALPYYGVAPYYYQWNNGDTTRTPNNLCIGIYSVTVTDSRGCVATGTGDVTIFSDFPVYNIVTSTVTDSSSCNGAAYVNFPSPVYYQLFTYLWNDSSTNYLNHVCAGWNTIRITSNFHGCVELDSFFVNINPLSTNCDALIEDTKPECDGFCNGSLQVNPTGAAPFNYVWQQPNFATTQVVNNLCAGIYSVILIDDSGCIDTTDIILTTKDTMIATYSILSASPAHPCSTLVNVNITNGIAPYYFDWCGVTSLNPAYLCPGQCLLTVEDSFGCTSHFTYDVPDSIVACSYVRIIQDVTSLSSCDGSVALTIFGNPPFTYNWTTGSTDSALNNLCEGTYYFIVTDSNGCVISDSVFIGIDGSTYIEKSETKNILTIYPNPGKNELNILLPDNFSKEIYLLQVYNTEGRLIYQSNSIEKIHVSQWPDGLYEICLKYENGTVTKRWLKN